MKFFLCNHLKNLQKIYQVLEKQSRWINTHSSDSETKKLYNLVELKNRNIIKVSGRDAFSYIQLITSNNLQKNQHCLNSYLISPDSRILSDLLIYKIKGDVFDKELVLNGLTSKNYGKRFEDCLKDNTLNESNENLVEELKKYKNQDDEEILYLECDSKLADSVRKTLFAHKLKQDVYFDIVDNLNVYAAFMPITFGENFLINNEYISNYFCLVNDPRLSYLGQRIITTLPENLLVKFLETYSFKQFEIKKKSLSEYRLHRYRLGVGEGLKEHWMNRICVNSFNGDFLNGLDLYKGRFTGTTKVERTINLKYKYMKRLLPLQFINPKNEKIVNLPPGNRFYSIENENPVGEFINNIDDYGIGYFKLNSFIHIHQNRTIRVKLYHDKKVLEAIVRIPFWWPCLSKLQYLRFEENLEYFRQNLLEQR